MAVDAAPAPTAPRRARWVPVVAAGLAYLGVSLLVWAHVWLTGDPAHTLTCPCGDVAQQLWWLEWFPRALQHGHNPFYSNALFARFGGINAESNLSWMLPAALLSPVTLAFGPIASFNAANLLAPVATGMAAYALAGRFTTLAWARFAAGLAYAFSPFVMGNVDIGHVNLTMLAYTPLVVLVGDRLLCGETSPRRAGITLGCLTVAEAFFGTEGLALTAGLVAGLLVALALVRRDVLAAAWRRVATAAAIGGAIAAVGLAYPVWVFFFGPAHVGGPFWTTTAELGLDRFVWPRADVGVPVHSTMLAGYEGARGPGTQFLGLGIVLVVLVGALVVRRRAAYAVLGIAAAALLVLEANPRRLVASVPLLNDVVSVRWAVGTTLCLSVMLAMVLDGWWRPARAPAVWVRAHLGRLGSGAAAVGCALAAFVPVAATYTLPFKVAPVSVPRWFATAGTRVPAGTAVLVVPFAWGSSDTAMVWQAEAGLRFALVGGFGYVPGADHRRASVLSPLPDATLLQQLSAGVTPLSDAQRTALRRLLVGWAPLEVVAVDGHVPPPVLVTLDGVLGPGVHADGATTWAVRRRG
ncbi:MAG TPA: hypothetical protein VGZ03_09965 [Acidimicrobiales bacterium]|nr:hypothetical protein [Acidimicrobiales bacterium]